MHFRANIGSMLIETIIDRILDTAMAASVACIVFMTFQAESLMLSIVICFILAIAVYICLYVTNFYLGIPATFIGIALVLWGLWRYGKG
jgi:hypothetical protein